MNWQSISTIVSAIALIGAYLYPSFRERWRVKFLGIVEEIDDERANIVVFIDNNSTKDFEVAGWTLYYKNLPEIAEVIAFPDNGDEPLKIIRGRRRGRIEIEVEKRNLPRIKAIALFDASGKAFTVRIRTRKSDIPVKT